MIGEVPPVFSVVGIAHGNHQTELMLSQNVLALEQNPYVFGESGLVSFGVFPLNIIPCPRFCDLRNCAC